MEARSVSVMPLPEWRIRLGTVPQTDFTAFKQEFANYALITNLAEKPETAALAPRTQHQQHNYGVQEEIKCGKPEI